MKPFRKWIYYGRSIFRILFNFKGWLPLIPSFFNPKIRQDHTVKLRKPSLRFIVRGAMDLWSIKETFLDAFYTRYGVPLKDGWQVVDIGAGIGDFSLYAAHGRPGTVVYSFEPYPESFNLLKQNLVLNSVDNVLAFQTAIWREAGQLTLDQSAGEPLQFNTKEGAVTGEANEGMVVNAITLKGVFDQFKIEKIDLLKLDCEGAEYAILSATAAETFEKIKHIIMEYHDIDDEKDHLRLALFLEDIGYQVSCYQNFVHEDIGYLFATC